MILKYGKKYRESGRFRNPCCMYLVVFFFFFLSIYLFGCTGSQLPLPESSLCHAGSFTEAHRFSSCGVQTPQLPSIGSKSSRLQQLQQAGLSAHGMWDLTSLTRDQTRVPCIAGWILKHWTPRAVSVVHFNGSIHIFQFCKMFMISLFDYFLPFVSSYLYLFSSVQSLSCVRLFATP